MTSEQRALPTAGLQLRSLVKSEGVLELSLVAIPVAAPGPDEVVVQVQAAPINPSDLGLLLGPLNGPANLGSAKVTDGPVVTLAIAPHLMGSLKARLDESMPVGNEAAGVVIAAGASDKAQALLGRTVAILGAAYSQYRTVRAGECFVLPEGVTAAQGASVFVNPLTALGMVETMRAEGHTALVHTAAASNLGQMLNRVCLKDGIGLVNVVRSAEQAKLLRDAGAVHVCDSTTPSFQDDLVAALVATGATLAFDAVGGGPLADQILTAMEKAANQNATTYSRYGSATWKQLYIYGVLNTAPTELKRQYGFAWGVGGWLLTPFLIKIGAEGGQRLRQRVAAELTTTFASHYTNVISLKDALNLDVMAAYNRRATGEKYLIDPSLD
jgi:NADPH2:quinone reductase